MALSLNVVITIVFTFFKPNFSLNCSEKAIHLCQCKEDGDRYDVDCSHLGLKSVPETYSHSDNASAHE